ncbi:MAG: amidohydrolase family protein [Planctomycetota bacterium]|nr:amidohydrolase family protein [Planctomycetota bacterium]
MSAGTTIYRAVAAADALGTQVRDAAVAVRAGRIVAAGEAGEVRRQVGEGDRVVDLGDVLILPALVNAHAHLDLTPIGPRPYDGDFVSWVEGLQRDRPRDPEAIASGVRRGLRLSREAGTGWVGDIASSVQSLRARVGAPPGTGVAGVSYLEMIGRGRDALAAAEANCRAAAASLVPSAWREDVAGEGAEDVRLAPGMGLQPHAPYSTGLDLYNLAASEPMDVPRSTHLAEMLEEERFIRDADGPFADFTRKIGKWDDSIRPAGIGPVAHLRATLARGRWLVAHCNYVDDADIAILHEAVASVAYCPIASEYFGHVAHRYRDMLAAGVNVCLGTDSILCQPAGEPQPLGLLPAMRRLHRRDGVDGQALLAMATWRGLVAMFGPGAREWASLRPGAPAMLAAVRIDPADATDALTQVLRSDEPARPVVMSC